MEMIFTIEKNIDRIYLYYLDRLNCIKIILF